MTREEPKGRVCFFAMFHPNQATPLFRFSSTAFHTVLERQKDFSFQNRNAICVMCGSQLLGYSTVPLTESGTPPS